MWVDAAAIHAVGGRWPRHCRLKSCTHRRDAGVYLAVNQIITLMLAMGFETWCGGEVDRGLQYLCQMVEPSC